MSHGSFFHKRSGKGDKSDRRDRTLQKYPALVKAGLHSCSLSSLSQLSFTEDSSNSSCSNFRSFLKFELHCKASFPADEEMLSTHPSECSSAEGEDSADSSTSKCGSLAFAVPSISWVNLFIVFQPFLEDSSTSKRSSSAFAVPSISWVELFIVFQPFLGIAFSVPRLGNL